VCDHNARQDAHEPGISTCQEGEHGWRAAVHLQVPMSLKSAAARRKTWKERAAALLLAAGGGGPRGQRMNAEQHRSNFMCRNLQTVPTTEPNFTV